ncbi:MAG: hypothetical protein WA118_13695 [Carboxydocellales bacterium]
MKCVFCGLEITADLHDSGYKCNCDNCGNYQITHPAFLALPHELQHELKDKKHLISGYLREMTELGIPTEIIKTDNYRNILLSSKIPKTVFEKLDKLLLFLYRRTEYLNHEIEVDRSKPATGYAISNVELENMFDTLSKLGFIQQSKVYGLRKFYITISGIARLEKIQKEVTNNDQCFVAMWFDDFMLNIFDKDMTKAIVDAGFRPFIIPMKEHNDDICDHIIAEIRNSRFLVADFTGQRGGVYFEAGFAYGLGMPVIWTCHEDWFNTEVDMEVDALVDGIQKKVLIKQLRFAHFDVNHYNFIVWKDGEDLYKKLKNRILATVPVK